MTDIETLARITAIIGLGAVLLAGLIVLGAIGFRVAGRRPGRRWGTALAFLFGVANGVAVIFTEGDLVQRAIPVAVVTIVTIALARYGRRIQAGALLFGGTLPWTVLWGYYLVTQTAGAAAIDPLGTWAAFLAGLIPTLIGVGLLALGDPPPPAPAPGNRVGQPGSRKIGTVAEVVLAPESIGPMPISEIASFVAVVVAVAAVGTLGLPGLAEPLVQVVVGTLVGSEVRILARPTRARRAFEAFSWLGEWELARAKALSGRNVPVTRGGAAAWVREVPDLPEHRWLRVECLLWLDRLEEARAAAEAMPEASAYDRFERAYALDMVDWMAGGEGVPDALRVATADLEAEAEADEETRLRADVALAIRDARMLAAERGREAGLEPLLAVRDRLGNRADGQLRRALWRRFLPLSAATAGLVTLVGIPFDLLGA